MKNIIFLILMAFIVISFYSCKDKKETLLVLPATKIKPIFRIPIDSTKLKPKIEFTYELIDSGGVKFTNKSKGIKEFKWRTAWYRSKAENPTFYFEQNAKYVCVLKVINDKGQEKDTTFYLNITHAPKTIKLDSSEVTGTIYGRKVNSKSVHWNDFYGGGLASLPLGTPNGKIYIDAHTILIADFMPVQGRDYASMKNNFKVGKQPVAQLKSYPTSDYSFSKNGWYILFSGQYGFYSTGNSPTDSLEILEIKEVYEKKLYPEMEDKAFWITWHIKADTGERGKIDCILKMKYLVYNFHLDF